MEYRSFSDLSNIIVKNINVIPKDVDLIVGVPRSGLLVANIIALLINKPITDLKGYEENRLISYGSTKKSESFIVDCRSAKKVLIIDDSVCSGKAIMNAKDSISKLGLLGVEYIYGCVYLAPGKEDIVDFFLEKVNMPRIFEWNIYHHPILERACLDIDGVLCEDPTEEQNDDGERYKDFLINAKPKIIPSVKVGALVSCRLSKYENETKEWMKKNDISFGELIMMDCSFEERRARGEHAIFKGDFYKKSNYVLFIESDSKQAKTIWEIAKKPVYCLEDNTFYDGGIVYKADKENKIVISIKRYIVKTKIGNFLYKKLKNK